MNRFFFLVLIFLISPLLFVHAQTVVSSDESPIQNLISSGISFVLYPQNPGPNDDVQASIESTTVDLETSQITWTLNGKVLGQGQGFKSVNFSTGPTGTKALLEVTILSVSGSIKKSILLNSNDVDLLWEGRGYVPPFYKGKTLWGTQTSMVLVAIPHILGSSGIEIKPETLIYKWLKDGYVLGNVSGYGKNTLSISDSVLSLPINIEVQVYNNTDTLIASKKMNFNPGAPKLLIFENNPLYGVLYNKEIGTTFSATNKEFSFVAVPLFFRTLKRNSQNITFSWQPNIQNSGDNSLVTYRVPDNSSGSSNVSVQATNSVQISQSAERSFKVQFNNSPTI